ncbi:glyoxalase superfamily protein [Chryseobacterium carnipullorum]|uniref:glyoxalase superfamily protein n=1 Tax=Chryseobacterium carnipullorum TaxID=1124835 RepID=UPI001E4B9F89|nr:glyoxalase superfamily protein [Chryseobacterium carnipullorum]
MAAYQRELIEKKYRYNRPGLEKAFYGAVSFTVNDPFGNTIIFNEEFDDEKHKGLQFYSGDH